MFPVDKPGEVESLWPVQRLDELLSLVDFLVLCVPLNATTRGMINTAAMQKMKAGAVLVNIARGPLVVESDLVAALESGHLAGAVIDVTEQEPLPSLQQALGPSPGDHHAARRRSGRLAKRQDHRALLPKPCRWNTPAADQLPLGQAAGFPIRGGGYPLWGEE